MRLFVASRITIYKRYDFNGYYLTDGLLQYYHYRNPHKHASCWVHAVRGFKDVLKVDRENKVASFICRKAAMLYKIDAEWRALLTRGVISEEEFIEERKWRSLVCIGWILGTVDDKRSKYSPGCMMGKAFKYIKDYEEYLTVYLDCIEATPSNNAVERMAKAFATGRKNWLFSQSVDGVDASCFFFSLIESAKLQGLNPEDYIEYVCTFGPYCRNEEEWETMLPWNADLSRLDDVRAARAMAKPGSAQKRALHSVGCCHLTSLTAFSTEASCKNERACTILCVIRKCYCKKGKTADDQEKHKGKGCNRSDSRPAGPAWHDSGRAVRSRRASEEAHIKACEQGA